MTGQLRLRKVQYLGGHPDAHGDLEYGNDLIVVDDGLYLWRGSTKFVIPWAEVTAITVEGPEAAEKRLTATRLLTVGVFAFAWKKNTSVSHLFVETSSYAVSFMLATGAGQLRAQLAPWTHKLVPRSGTDDTPLPPPTP